MPLLLFIIKIENLTTRIAGCQERPDPERQRPAAGGGEKPAPTTWFWAACENALASTWPQAGIMGGANIIILAYSV
jgi:hypothetical protein